MISTGSRDSEGLKGRKDRYLWWFIPWCLGVFGQKLDFVRWTFKHLGVVAATSEFQQSQQDLWSTRHLQAASKTRGWRDTGSTAVHLFIWKRKYGKDGTSGLQDAYPGKNIQVRMGACFIRLYIHCRSLMAKVEVGICGCWNEAVPGYPWKKHVVQPQGYSPNV